MKSKDHFFVGIAIIACFISIETNAQLKAEAAKSVYKPSWMTEDLNNSASKWCYERSKQSDNWIVFWESGFGVDPQEFDEDFLLSVAEASFTMNYDSLKFVNIGESKSDQYKMIILVNYSNDWAANGSGVDEVIGLLNLSIPAAGSATTIAHEIGHCFQYQAGADQYPLAAGAPKIGWRWGFGANGQGGNGWWEQCAQWQAFKVFPEMQFNGVGGHIASAHKHLLHENPRYENYFIQDFWTYLHGWSFVGSLWKETVYPEDPVETYQRLTGISQDEFNNEMYIRAARFATWDIPHIMEYGKSHILDRDPNPLTSYGEDGEWIVQEGKALQNYGYNVVRLNVPEGEQEVSVKFTGRAGMEGYRSIKVAEAGWRFGFVALLDNGQRVYSAMSKAKFHKPLNANPEESLSFTVPENCDKLWLIVSGAPQSHWHHPWDDEDANDEQWPYSVKFTDTNPYGDFFFNAGEVAKSDTLYEYVPQFPVVSDYPSVGVSPDWEVVCKAFKLNMAQLKSKMGSSIKYCAVNPDGSFDYNSTAIAPGHWFNENGEVTSWSNSDSKVFSEFRINNYVFNIGQYPGKCQEGDEILIKQALVYTPSEGDAVHVLFQFYIKLVSSDNLDGDSYNNSNDNCPGAYNEDQSDIDGDGVGDACDVCPGSDDLLDEDQDGVPDGCDICSDGDDYKDLDGDTVPYDCDVCLGHDDLLDSDSDGLADGCDVCPVSADHTDTDLDGVPDDCDMCEGYDDSNDEDEDSVPDDCDVCPGSSDLLDADNDGIPDGCDSSLSEDNSIELRIYPNPVKDHLQIVLSSSNLVNARVIVYDLLGRIQLEIEGKTLEISSINTHDLLAGVYILELQSDTKTSKIKFLKN